MTHLHLCKTTQKNKKKCLNLQIKITLKHKHSIYFCNSNQSKKRTNRLWKMNGLASISPLTMKLVRIITLFSSMCIEHPHFGEIDVNISFI